MLTRTVTRNGGEVISASNPVDAVSLLADETFKVDEIITDTFAEMDGLINGHWKDIHSIVRAREEQIRFSLISGAGIGPQELQELKDNGVNFIGREPFDRNKFISERFGQPGAREIKR